MDSKEGIYTTGNEGANMTKELKRFEKWWDAEDDIPNDGPYTPDTPIQFAWAGWQAALAQPERLAELGWQEIDCPICGGGARAFPKPEQEPMAWIERDMQCDDFDPDSVTCEKPTIAADGWEWVALYTTPPQRPWVGLTYKEVQETHDTYHRRMGPQEFASMIEAKLRSKNEHL